jgi:predicted transcriptional regulator
VKIVLTNRVGSNSKHDLKKNKQIKQVMTTKQYEANQMQMFSGAKKRTIDFLLQLFKQRPHSLTTLNKETNIAIATLSGRISDLYDLGLITETQKLTDKKHTLFSYVSDSAIQKQIAYKRQEEKYQKWLKKGQEMDWFNRAEGISV